MIAPLSMPAPLLEIQGLTVEISTSAESFPVVEDVDLSVPGGQVVALVGESGCGKSLTALSILQLLPRPAARITRGQILWHVAPSFETRNSKFKDGKSPLDLVQSSDVQLRQVRGGQIAMIFQEPMTALNPVFSVGEQIAEVLLIHRRMSRKEAWKAAAVLLDQVGISGPRERLKEYPHQLSGGMRQRVLIAMALAGEPKLLIADEPTTALDVTVQAQILELLRAIQAKTHMSVLLITHDLGVVAQFADYVYVMYAGRVVEHATTPELLTSPLHPYTAGLLRCTPRLDDGAALAPIPGTVPDPAAPPPGCRFHPRCELSRARAMDAGRASIQLAEGGRILRRCLQTYDGEPSGVPELRQMTPGHFVACWEA